MKRFAENQLTEFVRKYIRKLILSLTLIRSKYLVFLLFLVLSTLAWFIRSLNDTYVADLYYPVKYNNLPPNRILLSEPPSKLVLRVRADGYTILANKLRFKRTLNYDVNAFSLYSLSLDSTSVYQLTRYAREKLTAELNSSSKNISILNIEPDTIFFNFARVRNRKIPVRPILSTDETMFARQHMLNGKIRVIPDSVVAIGPSAIVDTLKFIPTEKITLNDLDDTTRKNAKIAQISRVKIPQKKVKVIIPVDRFTESEIEVPIELEHVPDSLVLKTFPKAVKINYLVTLSNFPKANAEMFHPYVDYRNIELKSSAKLKVQLDSLPGYIHGIKLSPQYVDYLIEIPSAKDWNNRRNR